MHVSWTPMAHRSAHNTRELSLGGKDSVDHSRLAYPKFTAGIVSGICVEPQSIVPNLFHLIVPDLVYSVAVHLPFLLNLFQIVMSGCIVICPRKAHGSIIFSQTRHILLALFHCM